jgi:TRAP-type C4-dicarboxylate transport system permease small subunit
LSSVRPATARPVSSRVRHALLWSDRIVLGIAATFSAIYLGAVAVQVLYRYVLEIASPWTEEMARYLFIWSAFLAAAVSVGRNDQFSIPLLLEKLTPGPRRALHIFVDLLQLTFALIMVRYGSMMASRMMMARAPVLPLPQGLVYMVIPIAGAYMAVHILCRLLLPGLRT